MEPLAWDGVRQGRGLESSETCVGVLITRRSQVQILPPLPTRHKQKARTNGPGLLFAHALTSSYPVKPVLGRSIDGWSGVGRFIV